MTGKHSKVLILDCLTFKFRVVLVRDPAVSRGIVNASKPISFAARTVSVATAKTMMDRWIEEFYSIVPPLGLIPS